MYRSLLSKFICITLIFYIVIANLVLLTNGNSIINQNNNSLTLEKGQNVVPFNMDNILPGDKESKNYQFLIQHKDTVELKLTVTNNDVNSNLIDVLMVKISNNNELIYIDTFKELISENLSITLNKNQEQKSQVNLKIEVFLPFDTPNSYQNQSINSDFTFQLEGQIRNNLIMQVVFGSALLILSTTIVLSWLKRRV